MLEQPQQQRKPRGNDVEVGVAIPIGCMVPLAIFAAATVVVGVLVGVWRSGGTASSLARG
jgi:hypothetical protein